MKISLNIIEKLIGQELPPVDELVDRISRQLGQVEEVIDLGTKYKGAKIVRVVECVKHPNADKLTVTKIDDGGIVRDVARDENGLIQVVCGAPNVHADMLAVWLPPKSIVPSSFDDAEPFVLGTRELRGVISNGMLASADELAIGDDHGGIVELTGKDAPDGEVLEVGMSFGEVFGLDGYVLDIENKMFTHRPDLFGQIGVAREIFAILQDLPPSDRHTETRFGTPDWLWANPEFEEASGLGLNVFNDSPENVPRFMAVAMKGIEVGESPMWLKCQLVAMGSKPINNIVDLTNYIMLMTAQPTHAYDFDKLADSTLGVRMAQKGETITLLNEKTYKLDESDIVIVDGNGPIGLAGVMGGLDSEISSQTKNIVLEVANFDMYAVRKTSMRHGLFTDAVTRFNKGQSPLQASRVIKRLIGLMPGNQASKVYDLPQKDSKFLQDSVHEPVTYTASFVNSLLGSDLTGAQIGNILRFAEFATHVPGDDPDELVSAAPYWRTDIELPEDIVEEVGRLYGYDELPHALPSRDSKPSSKNQTRQLKQQIRESMQRLGANELLTYSFVHKNVLEKAGQDPSQAYKLSNALSPDLQYYRLSVLPSLLDKVRPNIKTGHDEFILYEIGKGHDKTYPETDEDGLPVEYGLVDMVYASKKPKGGAPFYQIKQTANQLFGDLGIPIFIEPITEDYQSPMFEPFDLSRSALVWSETRNSPLGIIGEFKRSVLQKFKLPEYTAGASFDLKFIELWWRKSQPKYKPLSRFPSITKDVSLVMPGETVYSRVLDEVRQIALSSGLEVSIAPVSIYQADGSLQKTITFSLRFASYEKTLMDKDIAPIIAELENLSF